MMNPGALEEGAKAAGTLIQQLGSQPAVLALIVTVFALLGYVYYESHSFNSSRQEMVTSFLQAERENRTLLANCVMPEKKP